MSFRIHGTTQRPGWLRWSVLVGGTVAGVVLAGAAIVRLGFPEAWSDLRSRLQGQRTVRSVIEALGPLHRATLQARFEAQGCPYPPESLTLLALKREKRLEVWSRCEAAPRRLWTLPILGTSGHAGPKLKEGDGQIPEGEYRIIGFNPNSSYHLSMLLDYPTELDRQRAARDGRTHLGGEIFVHGSSVSIGCLAMGDEPIEQLFLLVHDTGVRRVRVLIAPCDLRQKPAADCKHPSSPEWVDDLYQELTRQLAPYWLPVT